MFCGVHFNDSHNTQPSENYLNLLIARIFAIEFSLQLATIHPTLNILFLGKNGEYNRIPYFFYVYHNFLSIWWSLAKYAYCHVIASTNNVVPQHMKQIPLEKKIRAREKKPGKVDNKNSMSKCVIIGLLQVYDECARAKQDCKNLNYHRTNENANHFVYIVMPDSTIDLYHTVHAYRC